jgi:hypothetical protein
MDTQVALLVQGLLWHASTLKSHVPPRLTVQSARNVSLNSYAQTPLAQPGKQAHENASAGMVSAVKVSECESVHPAKFSHGDDTHSSMSMSQRPPNATVQSAS